MTAALWERLLFAGLLLGSVAAFTARFGKVARTILSTKPEPTPVLTGVSRRVRDFVWEVLLQAKVIRERPLPGIAHALVFWGFCAFALVTLDHLGAGFGLRLLDREATFGRMYFLSAALFAAAVTVAIVGLAARRFITQPRWLGPKLSYESGLIALLIALLMLTYLADYLLHTGRVVWWLHTLALLVFLPLIPHTKHLHLVLSPITIFLKRPRFSEIPPLSGDEDFGLDTGKDLTQLVALQAYTCVECGRCTEHCPANNTGKILNPKEIILGVRDYLNEFGPAGEQPLLGTHVSQEAAFQCTTCGACEYQCPVGIQHLPVIIGLRRGAVNTGRWEDDHGSRLFLNLERNGNALGMSSSERDKFIQKSELPIFDGSQEYCLWLGCMGSYDSKGREIVTALARVLRHLKITFGVLKKERCTGDPARRLGNDLAFDELAARNLEALGQANVKKMVSICPHCVRTIGQDWRSHGDAPPIEHHSELLARYSARLPRQAAGGSVVFHDPCYLGRYRGIYDEPRAVAALAGPLQEAPRSHQRSFCCGAGGGLAFLGEEKGKRVSVERAEELIATGANVVAAACPFCNTMFRDALASISPAPPKLLDIAQIAAAAIDAEPARPLT